MKPPTKYSEVIRAGMEPREFMWNAYKYVWNSACDEWLKWHEELRLALGAQPGDDLIERANDLFEEADSMRDFIGSINSHLERTREKEIEHLRITLEEKDKEIEKLKESERAALHARDYWFSVAEEKQKQLNASSEHEDVLLKKLAQNNMKTDGWKTTAESRGNLIEELLREIAEKEDMLDTAAKLIKLQRDAMLLLLESVKTEKGEPNES